MTKMKLLGGVLLVLAVLFAQVGSAAAAPQTQTGTITGTVFQIGEPQTDANGVTTVPVILTVKAADGTETQVTVLVTPEVAGGLAVGDEFTANAGDVVPPEETPEPVHPISQLLADFFFGEDGAADPAMAATIDSWHTGENDADQVFGFGVIAQALWMATATGEDGTTTTDAELAGAILQAKKSGNYEEITKLLNLETTPSNWGQLKKELKAHNSVGQAKHEKSDSENSLEQQQSGKGQGNDKGNHGKGQGKGHGNKP